jgi:hypothetical protein
MHLKMFFANNHYLSPPNINKHIMSPIKILLVSVLVIFIFSAKAQHPSVTFFGGVNGAIMSFSQGDSYSELEDSYNMLYGLNIGALYDYVLSKDRSQELSVESGLIFETKGFDQEYQNDGLSLINKTTLYYLDIPVYLKYIYRFRSLNKIYFGAGPYVGLGLFGNTEYQFSYAGTDPQTNSEQINFGSDAVEDDFKRLDYGVSGKIGFLMDNGFNIALSYDYGLPNVATLDNIEEYKHRLIRLSLGYTLKFED